MAVQAPGDAGHHFISGGLSLDYLASTVVIQGLSGAAEHAELDKVMLEFTRKKHESLTASASLLYDFSKIALGALIASVTQVLKTSEKSKKTGEEEL